MEALSALYLCDHHDAMEIESHAGLYDFSVSVMNEALLPYYAISLVWMYEITYKHAAKE